MAGGRNGLALIGLVIMMALVTGCGPLSGEMSPSDTAFKRTEATVKSHPSQGDVRRIEGARAELFTTNRGATMTFRTSQLAPGHVHTAWWVVVNEPGACAASPCTAEDILMNTDAVQAEVTYADGIVVGNDGRGRFAAYLSRGNVPGPWFGHGFLRPLKAEIHIVINDHGPLIPGMAADMLTSYRGGCTDQSLPSAFPDTGKSDGTPGPNTCQLVQDAIFQQSTGHDE